MDTDVLEEMLLVCGLAVAVATKRSRRPKIKWCKKMVVRKG